VNEALTADPALVNSAAQGAGWLWKQTVSDESQLEGLMDEAGYKAHIG
jgi:glycine cleavage system H protein